VEYHRNTDLEANEWFNNNFCSIPTSTMTTSKLARIATDITGNKASRKKRDFLAVEWQPVLKAC
jgi:hypothetical protein